MFDFFLSVYRPDNSFLGFSYSGHSVVKCISSSTFLTQCRQKRSSAGIGIGICLTPALSVMQKKIILMTDKLFIYISP